MHLFLPRLFSALLSRRRPKFHMRHYRMSSRRARKRHPSLSRLDPAREAGIAAPHGRRHPLRPGGERCMRRTTPARIHDRWPANTRYRHPSAHHRVARRRPVDQAHRRAGRVQRKPSEADTRPSSITSATASMPPRSARAGTRRCASASRSRTASSHPRPSSRSSPPCRRRTCCHARCVRLVGSSGPCS